MLVMAEVVETVEEKAGEADASAAGAARGKEAVAAGRATAARTNYPFMQHTKLFACCIRPRYSCSVSQIHTEILSSKVLPMEPPRGE